MKDHKNETKKHKRARTEKTDIDEVNPYTNQNLNAGEYRDLLDSVVDEPNDLYEEYDQQVKKVYDAAQEDEETDDYLNAVADPGGLDPGFDQQLTRKNLKNVARRLR